VQLANCGLVIIIYKLTSPGNSYSLSSSRSFRSRCLLLCSWSSGGRCR